MGVTTFTDEYTYSIPPSRLFKGSILDSHNLIPKLMPQAIKSIVVVQGNGGAGSIKQINLAEGNCGTISKMTSKHYTLGVIEIEEEDKMSRLARVGPPGFTRRGSLSCAEP